MARKIRLQYAGALYHITSRGNKQLPIFRDDADRELFLKTLGEACAKTDWQVHAWCLLKTHFHLVVETPRPNLVDGTKWLVSTYTIRYNRRHRFFGAVMSGRYKALFVDESNDGYLKTVCDFVHLIPARSKLLSSREKLPAFRWSSYRFYLQQPSQRPSWLRVERLLRAHGIRKDSAAGRKEFARRMELRRASADGQEFRPLLRGWYFGGKAFHKKLLSQMGRLAKLKHYGKEVWESAEAKAERVIKEELKKLKWKEKDLVQRRKGDPKKIKIAQRLRRETTMSFGWIAQRLHMGATSSLTNLVYWHQRNK